MKRGSKRKCKGGERTGKAPSGTTENLACPWGLLKQIRHKKGKRVRILGKSTEGGGGVRGKKKVHSGKRPGRFSGEKKDGKAGWG